MPKLLWTSYFRYLRRNLWLLGLSLCAIATSVAVILAIDIASISARRSFSLSTEALVGRSTHSLVAAGRPLEEEMFRRVRLDWGYRQSAPVVSGYLNFALPGQEDPLVLSLLGVDPISDSSVREWTGGDFRLRQGERGGVGGLMGSQGNVVATENTARRLGWEVGQARKVLVGTREVELVLAGLFTPSSDRSGSALDNVILTDIGVAQVILGQLGELDQIDLVLTEDEEIDRLKGLLPEGVFLQQAGQSQQTARELSRAFHINLRALSYLCLLVAAFLILNVVSFSVAHRRQSLGRLRILGVTSRELASLLRGEALVLGGLGSLLGVCAGLVLGRAMVPLVTRTLNDLYYVHSITGFEVDPLLILKAFACGLGATLVASHMPASQAAGTPPLELLYKVNDGRAEGMAVKGGAIFGALLLLGAGLALDRPGLTAGLFALLLIVLGAGLLVPLLLSVAVRLATRVMRGPASRMALRGLSAYIERTGLAAVALTIAIAATISIAMMVSSFRGTLQSWLETTLTADIYLSLRDRAGLGNGQALPPEQVARALDLPGVTDWVGQRISTVPSSTGETFLIGVRPSRAYSESLVFLEQEERAWERFLSGEGVFVTEPYSKRHGMRPGRQLVLATPKGEKTLPVLGVYYSFAPDRNLALLHWERFQEWFEQDSLSGLGLYTQESELSQTLSSLRGLFGERVEVRSTRELRKLALEIFERTFTVTEVLRFLALLVAFVGVFLSLLALALERSSEVQVLRALGFRKSELLRLSLLQSGYLGAVSGVLAFPLGTALAYVMITVINRRAFGWTITFVPDWGGTLTSLGLGVGAALLAGLYPAWKWSRAGENSLRERD